MTPDIWQSIAISAAAAFAAYACAFLTLSAAVAASLTGLIVLVCGGWDWGAAAAGSFFLTALLSQRQDRLDAGEGKFTKVPRDVKQVLANGLLLAALALLYRRGHGSNATVATYLGAVGAVAGDTWASAAAVFSARTPRLLTSLRPVPAGTPGAVSIPGIALTVLAGFIAAALLVGTRAIVGDAAAPAIACVALCTAAVIGALAGSLFDSYLGAACQAIYRDADARLTDHPVADDGRVNIYIRGWRWLSNDLVNFANSVAGAAAAYCVWRAAGWLHVF